MRDELLEVLRDLKSQLRARRGSGYLPEEEEIDPSELPLREAEEASALAEEGEDLEAADELADSEAALELLDEEELEKEPLPELEDIDRSEIDDFLGSRRKPRGSSISISVIPTAKSPMPKPAGKRGR